ncbi:molecular chaperone DnaJ [Candidatus Woesearchaeota archaeon]|jgi:molecular chaperone DnaJ|nr:molecular chaperone DnaJ [Candidatus Woesearchaeota archaeon]MBT3536971.1 molecular chaperone DnaJ [Candidatus Woesearchaeota archaeon]MBT4697581.1 molecular chaperone DnaJ [Candidatus Woesearchaeota archaeon]MBT4717695.1 molecular chaperone DnaJ [Candidatus Woesearchaeota archaeon]MBT7106719.1 molecular chaperone DnaJ [Candidatus Woesearchaeota archaeon]
MGNDYYKTLGLSKGASKEEIKKAYKRLAKKFHPDLNKEDDASDKFKEINEAAAVLGDDKKRAHYDQYGTADFSGFQGGAGGFDFSDFSNFGGFSDFGDIFDMFFGGGRRRGAHGPQRGSDLRYDLEITLEEAASGVNKSLSLERETTCSTCDGKGAKSDSDIVTCDGCGGSGQVTRSQRTPFGVFQTASACPTCGGEGKKIVNPCSKCHGSGSVLNKTKLSVDIPAGVDAGSRLRLAGEGEAGKKGGPSGDLYAFLHVKPHKIFQRDGLDLYSDVPISFIQATLGDEIEVPTLDGKAKMKIPAGTQPGTMFRLKGLGIKSLRGFGVGDQKVRVDVKIPKSLSKTQKQLLRNYAKESADDIQANKGFFSKLKEAFE